MTDTTGGGAGQAAEGLLIDADTLALELAGARPRVVLDVRWSLSGTPGREAYRAGHLPGAAFVDLDTELSGRPGVDGRHPLPGAGEFEAAMRAHGVCRDSSVVVYDAADCSAAARAWWNLRYFGHADVRLLDGGYAGWVRAGHPVSTDEPVVRPGDFVAAPVPPCSRRTARWSTSARRSASAARSSHSIGSPVTCPVRSTCRPAATSVPTEDISTSRNYGRGSPWPG
jgi:3-mercaptopyruvate sulfurtransferase SseA